jgi:hypothetical protein
MPLAYPFNPLFASNKNTLDKPRHFYWRARRDLTLLKQPFGLRAAKAHWALSFKSHASQDFGSLLGIQNKNSL